MSFSDVVEAVKTLSLEEKEEIQKLLVQYLREERREEIYQNYLASKEEENAGNLKFSSNIDELIQFLED
jgi:alpha-ketoglutarate-dependent taurine dioxygenase